MADKDFVVKNGIVVNTSFTANSTLVAANALNVALQTNTATLYVTTSATVGTSFTANATLTNAVALSTGANFLANNTGVYTATVNAASHTVGTNFVANSTGVYAGVANATSYSATGFAANSTGVYANAVVNAASLTVGSAVIANTSGIKVGSNVTVNTTAVFVGNSVANVIVGMGTLTLNGNAFISAAGYYKGNFGAYGNPQGANNLFRINANSQVANITISAGENALAAGPLTVASGFNLTVEAGGRAVIV